jgi:hypothetical protein
VKHDPGFLNSPRLRPADVLGLIAILVTAAFWAYLYADSPTPEPTRDTAPAPWTPASSSPAVEVGEP